MLRRIWIVAVTLVLLLVPCEAFAEEVTTRQDGRLPTNEVLADDTAEYGLFGFGLLAAGNPVFNKIASVVSSWNRVTVGTSKVTIVQYIRYVLIGRTSNSGTPAEWTVMPVALLLILMWWAVRKTVRMIFKALRKGKFHV